MAADRIATWPGALLVAAVAFAASATTLRNGFVFDDLQNVLQNPWIRDRGRLMEAFTHHVAGFDPSAPPAYYRPLMHVAYAGVYAASGLRPWAFHFLNLLVHAAVCAVVYVLLARRVPTGMADLVSHDGSRGAVRARGRLLPAAPLLASVLFAVYPVHAEAVAWVGALPDLGASLFFLLALLAATAKEASPSVRLLVAPALWLVAMLWKEPAAVLPAVVFVARAAGGDLAERRSRRDALWQVGLFAIVAMVYLVLRAHALGGMMGAARASGAAAWDRVMTIVALFGAYLRTLLVPVDLTVLHQLRPVTSIGDPRAWAGAVALLAIGAFTWRARARPAVVLGVAVFVLTLLPAAVAPVVGAFYARVVGEGAFAERYLYLPSVGAALLLAIALEARWKLTAPARFVGAGAAAFAIVACSVATLERNTVWRDGVSLWSDAARNLPASATVHEFLGHALLASGRPGDAVTSLERALTLDPGRAEVRANLASALVGVGRFREAAEQALVAIRERPELPLSYAALGYALAGQGRLQDAASALERAVVIDPSLAPVHNALGIAYLELGRRDASVGEFREALRLDPGSVDYARNLMEVSRMRQPEGGASSDPVHPSGVSNEPAGR